MNVISISGSVLILGLLTFTVSYQNTYQSKPALINFQQELLYPSSNNDRTRRTNGAPSQLSSDPNLVHSPLHEIQPLPALNNILYNTANIFEDSPRIPPFHPNSLFTPNTIDQPAETKGQIENYRKALEEEAMEAENEQNSVFAQFEESALNKGTIRPTVTVFVKSRDYNYNYSV